MSNNDTTGSIGTDLAFYPSVRHGFQPEAPFNRSETTIENPSTVTVEVTVTGYDSSGANTSVTPGTDVQIHGPGDVVGIDEAAIVRRDPPPDSNDFPPNYLPFVEFDRADFPWLFAPTRADDRGRNRPWCVLVVVNKHANGVSFERGGDGPILTAPVEELPDLAESWAWAHAQVLGGRPATETAEEDLFRGRSNRTVARLLCPRNLNASTTYLAAVVPTYEPGRRAGLGLAPYPTDGAEDGTLTTRLAWTDADQTVRLPVYDAWEFSTSPGGDFEQLVRELEPRDLGPDVGSRTVDTSNPGPEQLRYAPGSEGASVTMGGALQSPEQAGDPDPYGSDPTDPSDPHSQLREIVNQPETVLEELGLPAVGPPRYGQWAADERVLRPPSDDAPRWFDELNTDPRHRSTAGFGTQVIQERQEELVERAWKQFGELAAANERLRVSQLAVDSLRGRYDDLHRADVDELVQFAGPLLRFQSAGDRKTFLNELGDRGVPPAVTTPAFRRITRATGPLFRRPVVDATPETFVDRFGRSDDVAISPGKLVGRREFSEYGRTIEQLALDEGFTPDDGLILGDDGPVLGDDGPVLGGGGPVLGDDGPVLGGGGPRQPDGDVPDWRRIDGQVVSVSEAIAYYEANPDADPDARDVALAVKALTELEDRLLDLQTRLATTSRIAAAATSGRRAAIDRRSLDIDTGDQLSIDWQRVSGIDETFDNLGERTVRDVERRVGAIADTHRDAVGTELTETQVTETIEEVETDLDRLLDTLEGLQPDANPDDVTARITEGEQVLSRILDRVERLSEHVYVGGEVDDQPEQTRRDPFEPIELRAFTDGAVGGGPSPLVPTRPVEDGPSRPTDDGPPRFSEERPGGLEDRPTGDVRELRTSLIASLDPQTDVRMRLSGVLSLDPEALTARPNPLDELLAHPRYYEPTYEALRDLDEQYLMPGAGNVPENTIGALVTNPAFVEAFMAGLNHEMSRELRWHRFPTDRRGTYFRHFWDRRGTPGSGDVDERADVTPLHTWGRRSLGSNHPEGDDDPVPTVVLVIRGQLLRRYPDTIVYMTKAVESNPDTPGEPAARLPYMPGRPETPTPTDFVGTDPQRFPDFHGTLEPDLTFFGFDLTVEEAVADPYHRPDTPEPADHDDQGWFFVLEEPPGELHFGLDEADPDDASVPPGITHTVDGTPVTRTVPADASIHRVARGWDALSWGHVVDDGDPGTVRFLSVEDSPLGTAEWAVEAGTAYADGRTWGEKDAAEWGYNSAHVARAVMQRPSRVSVHADDLLPDPSESPVPDGGHRTASDGGRR